MIVFFAAMAGAFVGGFVGIFAIVWTILYAIDKANRGEHHDQQDRVSEGRRGISPVGIISAAVGLAGMAQREQE